MRIPLDAVRVESISARYKRPQLYRDPWRGEERVCEYHGDCVVCGRRTYGFTDGEDDPRGPLGDRASSPLVAKDYDETGPDVPVCFPCANEEWRYNSALSIARRRWARYRA